MAYKGGHLSTCQTNMTVLGGSALTGCLVGRVNRQLGLVMTSRINKVQVPLLLGSLAVQFLIPILRLVAGVGEQTLHPRFAMPPIAMPPIVIASAFPAHSTGNISRIAASE